MPAPFSPSRLGVRPGDRTPSTDGVSSGHGFTLIELLAVIAIMGVLSSVLIISIQRVRASARDAQCLSNLRGLALAHSLFRNEFNRQSPPGNAKPDHPLSNGHNVPGLALLRRYYRPAATDYVYAQGSYLIEKTELCPAADSPDTRANQANPDRGPDYGMLCNNAGTNPDGTPNNLSSSSSNVSLKYDLFYTSPAQTPLIWDAWDGIWTSTPRRFPPRHGGGEGINVAFLDGHVSYLPRTDGRLYKDWWNYAYKNPTPDDSLLGRGQPLVSETR